MALDARLELQRLEWERDQRVRRVLEQARQREERRQEALRRVTAERPPAPEHRLVLMQKAHQQALAVWERARVAAEQLVVQAQRLAERLREQLNPDRLRTWAAGLMRRAQPKAYAVYEVDQKRVEQAAEAQRAIAKGRRERANAEGFPWPRDMTEQERRDWNFFHELRLAERSRSLGLAEMRELANGWGQLQMFIDKGALSASAEERQAFEAMRRSAHHKLHAAVFESVAPIEGSRAHPELAGAYMFHAAIEKKLAAAGFNDEQQRAGSEQARRRIAESIAEGKYPQVHLRETVEVSRELEQDKRRDLGRTR